MASGPPTWFRQMRVSGNACANAVSSSICGWYSQASKLRFSGARQEKPWRNVASAAGADMRLQHRTRARTQPQVGVANNTGADLRLAIATRGAHRRDPIDE